MAFDDPQAPRRIDLIKRAGALSAENYAIYFREQELGTALSFEIATPIFEKIWWLLAKITEERIRFLPSQALERLNVFLNNLGQILSEIRGFSVAQHHNASGQRNTLVSRLEQEFMSLLQETPWLIGFLSATIQQENDDVRKASETLKRMADAEAKLTKEASEKMREADDIVAKMRQASGSLALQSYSSFFSKEASRARYVALGWLAATALVLGGIGCYLHWLVFVWSPSIQSNLANSSVQQPTPMQVVQSGAAKLALFTVAFYVLSWCGRNFKAQWHICVVNRHRANTLNALEAFSNSAKNEQTREAILIHASSAIFAQTNTGYLPDQADSPNMPSMLEIIRSKGD